MRSPRKYDTCIIVGIKLTLQEALVGLVTANLVRVSFRVEAKVVALQFLFAGSINKADLEISRVVGTEVVAELPADYQLLEEFRTFEPEDVGWREGVYTVFERRSESADLEKWEVGWR